MARSEPQGGHFATDRLISDFGPPPPGPAATAWSQTTTEQIKPASESVDKVVLDLGEKVDTLIEMLKAMEAKIDGVTPPGEDVMDSALQLVMTLSEALDVVIGRLGLKDGTELSDDEQQAVDDFSDFLQQMQALKADTSPPRLTLVELDRMLDGLKALKTQDPPAYQQMVNRLREVIG